MYSCLICALKINLEKIKSGIWLTHDNYVFLGRASRGADRSSQAEWKKHRRGTDSSGGGSQRLLLPLITLRLCTHVSLAPGLGNFPEALTSWENPSSHGLWAKGVGWGVFELAFSSFFPVFYKIQHMMSGRENWGFREERSGFLLGLVPRREMFLDKSNPRVKQTFDNDFKNILYSMFEWHT